MQQGFPGFSHAALSPPSMRPRLFATNHTDGHERPRRAFNEAAAPPYATAFPGDQFGTSTSWRVRENSAQAVLIEAYWE